MNNHYPKQQPQGGKSNLPVVLTIVGGVIVLAIIGAICFFKAMDNKEEKAPEQPAKTETVTVITQAAPTAEDVAPTAEDPAPVKEKKEKPKVDNSFDTSHASMIGWRNGKNVLIGDFHFQGADYGFTVTVNYNNGRLSNPRYEAHGYGGTSSLSSARLSDDGETIILEGKASGTKTYIKASMGEGNEFYGKMVRGTHSGTCSMNLQ